MVLDKLNQSLIKDIGHGYACPMRFKLYYLDKTLKNAATQPMIKGQYFEMKTLGSIAQDGSIPEIPLLKNGEKSVGHQRIDQQVQTFLKMLEDNAVEILETDVKLEAELELPDGRVITVYGTLDGVFGTFLGKEIIDTKLTSDITSTFSPYSWGNWEIMDKLQAYMYSYLYEKNMGEKLPFAFHVYDYKPVPEYDEFRIEYDESNTDILKDRVYETVLIIQEMEENGFKPEPTVDECSKCLADCPMRAANARVKLAEQLINK